jgi:hypothetical protein
MNRRIHVPKSLTRRRLYVCSHNFTAIDLPTPWFFHGEILCSLHGELCYRLPFSRGETGLTGMPSLRVSLRPPQEGRSISGVAISYNGWQACPENALVVSYGSTDLVLPPFHLNLACDEIRIQVEQNSGASTVCTVLACHSEGMK